jgi:threonine synthase
MMTTVKDENVHVGDRRYVRDCQAIVKGMFNHHAFRDRTRLSGVNSINWARIVAQAVYYFTAAVALGSPRRKVAFTVPTGNFGDVYAGYVALCLGLPIDRLVIATNVNDILARTIATGAYDLREVVATSSPSMDIQVASTERLLFEVHDAMAARCQLMVSPACRAGLRSPARACGDTHNISADRADGTRLRDHPHHAAETDISSIRTPPWALPSPKGNPRSVDPDGGARTAHSANSRCGGGGSHMRPPLPNG